MTVFYIIIAILVIILLLLFIPSKVRYSFEMDKNYRHQSLVFSYLFIKIPLIPRKDVNKKKKKSKKVEEEKKEKFSVQKKIDEIKGIVALLKSVKDDVFVILEYAKQHAVTVKSIDFDMEFDTEDPMRTGILTGTINGGVYNVLAILDNTVGINDWNIDIRPLFQNQELLKINFCGIVKIKNVHIIIIVSKILKLYLKIRKIKKAEEKITA